MSSSQSSLSQYSAKPTAKPPGNSHVHEDYDGEEMSANQGKSVVSVLPQELFSEQVSHICILD